jgi:hypothetical protein
LEPGPAPQPPIARQRRLGDHRLGGFLQGEENAHRGFFTIQHPDQIPNHRDADVFAALDGDEAAVGFFARINHPVDTLVRALLAALAPIRTGHAGIGDVFE